MTKAPVQNGLHTSAMTTVANARHAGRQKLASVETPVLDVDVLLAYVLGWTRDQLFGRSQDAMTEDEVSRYERCLDRRASGTPVAYIIGYKEWFGFRLRVDESVLIPRPETELLAELTIDTARQLLNSVAYDSRLTATGQRLVKQNEGRGVSHPPPSLRSGPGVEPDVRMPAATTDTSDDRRGDTAVAPGRSMPATTPNSNTCVTQRSHRRPLSIVDVGTGSGAIAIAIATSLADVRVIGIDNSAGALKIAASNIRDLAVEDRVTLIAGDLLSPIEQEPDIILANLPYIPAGDWATLSPEVRSEPRPALVGGETGLEVIERLLCQLAEHRWRTIVLLEIDPRQAHDVKLLVRGLFPTARLQFHPDLAGHTRIVIIQPLAPQLSGVMSIV
jgi:methylase of polypeptide subunit release factors